jgi:hypothetical protein
MPFENEVVMNDATLAIKQQLQRHRPFRAVCIKFSQKMVTFCMKLGILIVIHEVSILFQHQ